MLPPGLKTPREVTLYYDDLYNTLVDSGKAHPFIYPWAAIGAFVVFAYLLIDHRQSPALKWCRYPVFAFTLAFQTWCIFTNRARTPASALGVGLISSWGTMWIAAIMIFNDCQTDFRRIERAVKTDEHAYSLANGSLPNGKSNDAVTAPYTNAGLRQRREPSSIWQEASTKGAALREGSFFWQSYPDSPFVERLDWIADVFCSFRGVGWNWQTSGVPPPPRWVEAELNGEDHMDGEAETLRESRTGVRRFNNRAALLRHAAVSLAFGYFALDVLATVMHRDPYFWGYEMQAPAPAYLPDFVRASYVLTKSYRLLLSLAAIYTALWTIFKLGPAFFCGVLGTKWIGVRGEPWMNPLDAFGSFTTVLDNGLAGWWSHWWHQTFRFAFEAPTTQLLKVSGISKRSITGRVISLLVAFFLSGCIHASGSHTQLGDTRPLTGPMLFFLLQAVGILAQTLLVQQLTQWGLVERCPKVVRRMINFLVVPLWLYFTAPLLVDDFARGGVWLFEPVAFSPLRALGLGAPDDRFFCWWDGLIQWRSGEHWWDTGLAL